MTIGRCIKGKARKGSTEDEFYVHIIKYEEVMCASMYFVHTNAPA
jgi:hypothetical protein